MSEVTADPAAPAAPPIPAPALTPPQPPAPAPGGDATDWKAEARKWEDRAKENKAAAEKLTELEEAAKTDAQRQAEALAAAQREAEEAKATVIRHEVAAAKGVPASLLKGSTKDEFEAHADELIAFKAASTARPPAPNPMQGNGGGQPTPGSPADEFAAWLQNSLT